MVIRQQNSYFPQLVRLSNARRSKHPITMVLGAQGTFVFFARCRSEHVLSLIAGRTLG
jgi:hypothetical protein